jgi:hypothetical protein
MTTNRRRAAEKLASHQAERAGDAAVTSDADLAGMLGTVLLFIKRFVVLRKAEATLVALWITLTHVIDAFDYTAYLHITSPLPECGKTRLLEVTESLVPKPWLTGRVTAAVLMRKVDAEQPVLLLDESDAAFSGPEDYAEALRGLLNSGFARTGVASSCVGQGAQLSWKDFKTFCPKAIAGIGRLPGTIESRSIPIALKRRTKGETVEKWRRKAAWAEADPIRGALIAWASRHTSELKHVPAPPMPSGLSDRAEDVLEPLFILADVAGGGWPEAARLAAVELMGHEARNDAAADQSIGLELLADVQRVFVSKNSPAKLRTEDVITGLCALEDSPWATFTNGEKLTPHKLARLLRGFDVKPPRKMRARGAEKPFRGYYLDALDDAFSRYLPSEVEQAEQPNDHGPELAVSEAEHASAVPLRNTANDAIDTGLVPLVPLSHSDPEDEGDGDVRI